MQLNKSRYMRAGLSSACMTLLGSSFDANAQDKTWEVESGFLFFTEEDRTTGIEWLMEGRFEQDNEEQLNLRLEFDSVVGSSPNGATATNQSQTFTSASGKDSYTVPANSLPLDPDFNDQRLGIAAKKIKPLSRDKKLSYGGAFAQEFDYFNVDLDVEIEQSLNQKNTVINYGTWSSYNRIHPVGGIPIGLAEMTAEDTFQPRGIAAKSKRQFKAWAGVTQNIDRNSRVNFNLELLQQNGYLTDPYKLVSVVEGIDLATLGETVNIIYENRPALRNASSISVSYKLFVNPDIMSASYRFYNDDWNVTSHTIDINYRFRQSDASYWEPVIRLYHQSAADFFRHSLTSDESTPQYVSADLRLAEFTAVTIGVSYGSRAQKNKKSEWKFLYYQKSGDGSPDDAIGVQTGQNLFPDLSAVIVQYVYSLQW